MLGSRRPAWALPDGAGSDDRLGRLAPLVGVLVALLPLLALRRPDADAPRAVALAVTAGGAVAAAVALRLLARVRDDRRLQVVAAGFAAVAVVAAVRGLASPLPPRRDLVLVLAQVAAVPAAALLAVRGADLRRLALSLGALLAVAVAAARLAPAPGPRAGGALTLLAGLLAAAAAVLWVRDAPAGDAGPHLWVALALVVPVAGTLVRAADSTSRTGLALVPAAGPAVAGTGLALVSCARTRRQARRWRDLERQVRSVRSSSPLLPGRAVTPEDDEGLPSRADVEALLARADVEVALQPVVELAGGRVVGHEALARFAGRTSPDRWFRGAGHSGMTARLELLTLRRALARLPHLDPPLFLSVNLSPLALVDPAVRDALLGADLARVVVEVTEHEAVRDYAAFRRRLQELRRAGARVAVDDVGAGFASLRHVQQLRPDVVKLDHSLTRGVEQDEAQRAVVVALLRFAGQVGVTVIAEGVETSEQAAALRDLGVELGQGWGLGVPVLQRDEPG